MSGSTSNATNPLIRNAIGSVAVRDIVAKHETPTYVYDAESIERRIADLASFDVIRYAQKANSNLAILDLVRRHGVLVDAVSAGEILRAMAAGFPTDGSPAPIVYTADLFDRETLDLIAKHNLHCNLGSADMIEQYAEHVGKGSVTLRLNPGFGHGHSQKTNTGGPQSKHGIWHEELPEVMSRIEKAGLTVSGLHMHIGSGTDLEHLAQVCGAMHQAALHVGESLTSISAGGGLPISYRDEDPEIDLQRYFELWDEVRLDLANRYGHPISLEIEPGRYLAAESGYLISEIRAIKKMGDNTFYIVDAGFNTLARPILYGAYHPMSLCPADGRELSEEVDVVVGGPLCESGDIFTQDEGGFVAQRRLPKAQVGDLLVIEYAGAYGNVMASNYNSKPFPAEVLVRQDSAELIRKRQSLEDVFQYDRIPDNGG